MGIPPHHAPRHQTRCHSHTQHNIPPLLLLQVVDPTVMLQPSHEGRWVVGRATRGVGMGDADAMWWCCWGVGIEKRVAVVVVV